MTTRPARSTPALGELIVALALLTLVAIGSALHVMQLDLDPVTRGLILTSLSGIGGMAGFLGASCFVCDHGRPSASVLHHATG